VPEADFARERLLKGESQKIDEQRTSGWAPASVFAIPIHVFPGKELL
jgi:hypothetical protein